MVREAAGDGGEARIVGELGRRARCAAASAAHSASSRDGDAEPAVLAAAPVDALRRVLGVTVADARAVRMPSWQSTNDVAEMVHLVLDLRELDELAAPGGVAVVQRRRARRTRRPDPVAASMYVVDGVSTSSLSW